jgi:Uma2 family endonuclease
MGPWIDLAPDWVCEVLSPSTRRLDLGPKRDIYARAGVGHIWLVDPEALTLEAFELREGRWSLLATVTDTAAVRLAPFDAVEFPLSALWPD